MNSPLPTSTRRHREKTVSVSKEEPSWDKGPGRGTSQDVRHAASRDGIYFDGFTESNQNCVVS